MMDLVVLMMMMRLAALTVSCLSALVADGRPTQTACGAIDPNGRPTVANGRPNQTPRGAIDPNGRPTVANGRPAQTPCGDHSAPTTQPPRRAAHPFGAALKLLSSCKAVPSLSANTSITSRGTGPKSCVQARSRSSRSQQIVHRERLSGLNAGSGGTTRVTKGNSRAQ